MVLEQQRDLHEAQAVEQIEMEGRRERITLPTSTWDLFPGLAQSGVIQRSHHWPPWIALLIFIKDWIEQAFRLPGRAREHSIIGAPITITAAQSPQRARDSASAQDTDRSNSMFYGA